MWAAVKERNEGAPNGSSWVMVNFICGLQLSCEIGLNGYPSDVEVRKDHFRKTWRILHSTFGSVTIRESIHAVVLSKFTFWQLRSPLNIIAAFFVIRGFKGDNAEDSGSCTVNYGSHSASYVCCSLTPNALYHNSSWSYMKVHGTEKMLAVMLYNLNVFKWTGTET